MSTTEFIAWVHDELTKRGWGQAEFARRSHMTTAQVSCIITGENQAGPDSCSKIARAFKLSPVEVSHLAGLLPHERNASEGSDELLYYFSHIQDEERRRVLLAMARAVFELDNENHAGRDQ